MKKLLVLVLALALMFSSTAFAANDFDVIGTYSQYPLVDDGSVTLSVMVPMSDSYAANWEDAWFWKWWKETTGINFEVEQILSSALAERKSLMFASCELPDILMGMGINTDEVVRYGIGEELLLSFSDYYTADVMPNLTKLYEAFPVAKANATAPNGKSYTLPFFVNQPGLDGESTRLFIDQNRMDAVGVAVPETLDELVAMLYAFKEADPDCVPLGGSFSSMNPFVYILNAYGFLGNADNDGTAITVRNGEAVIPAGDPLYKEFLALMNKFYTDGIITEDFFTADNTVVNAQMAQGLLGIYPSVPFLVTPDYEDFSHWTSITPLTSEYSDTKQWLAYNTFSVGGFAASADTKYGEMIARLADFFYSDFGYQYVWMGPWYGSSDCMGLVEGDCIWLDWDNLNSYGEPALIDDWKDVIDGKYEGTYDFIYHETGAVFAFGNNGISLGLTEQYGYDIDWRCEYRLLGMGWLEDSDYEYYKENFENYYQHSFEWNPMQEEGQFRGSMQKWVSPYEISGYPAVTYFDEETAQAMNDIKTVVQPYINAETAKFITGVRSLDEFDAYIGEIEAMGFRDLENAYKDMWASYQASIG